MIMWKKGDIAICIINCNWIRGKTGSRTPGPYNVEENEVVGIMYEDGELGLAFSKYGSDDPFVATEFRKKADHSARWTANKKSKKPQEV